MIELVKVQARDRELLWNINQKYLYEMTNFYNDKMDEAGNYHYGHFEEYFTDPRREALLIRHEGTLIGFAMIIPYSYFDETPDHVMAEFTVFPAFRKRHLAEETVRSIFSLYPGRWEIKYNENNAPAKALWEKVTAAYCPVRRSYSAVETVLCFKVG